jgi:glucose/arabinose dehydrogenase
LEPSVSAYHLAIDTKDRLYVTGPTLSMRDPLYRIAAHGKVEVVLQGLARPQGMAFLPDGDLLIAASCGGKKGVFRFSPETGQLGHYIAGPMLVGLAVAQDAIILADSSSIYRLQPSWAVKQVV